jgi:hypothetical protein
VAAEVRLVPLLPAEQGCPSLPASLCSSQPQWVAPVSCLLGPIPAAARAGAVVGLFAGMSRRFVLQVADALSLLQTQNQMSNQLQKDQQVSMRTYVRFVFERLIRHGVEDVVVFLFTL